ncbi:MAG: RecQ family ATP-dependent DNA helicase [Bacteroidota bacterium]
MPLHPSPAELLKQYWGHAQFRPLQEDIIQSVLDQHDTLAVLPTGGGKSICFQVPGLSLGGCCIVISPLVALMEDQVARLQSMGISAAALIAGTSAQDVHAMLQQCAEGDLQFLYVSPERLENDRFMNELSDLPITLIAIDEAHCISQWGYDFRPSYLHIARIRERLPHVRMIALTASATKKVQTDIADKLGWKSHQFFMGSFERKNLSYATENTGDKINATLKWLKKIPGSAIVYCKTRRKTKEIADLLRLHGIECDYYHAGLDRDTRKLKQTSWINSHTSVMACTNAFGMGIDKPNVRLVIHVDVPDCLESYYQEAGRAGRDEQPAHAVLLYTDTELDELRRLPEVKYPPMSVIRTVYQSLCNYLQLPVGSRAGEYYDFDMEAFLKRFPVSASDTLNSLQALRQEQVIAYIDKVFQSSQVEFIADRQGIEDAEQFHPELESLIKALLRSYGGILDFSVSIQETKLAWQLGTGITEIREQLIRLDQLGVIAYSPRKETPQVCLLQDRINSAELSIDHARYLLRKKEYAHRIACVIDYATSNACKSSFISSYFGADHQNECGICSSCRKKAASTIPLTDLNRCATLIRQHLADGTKTREQLTTATGHSENAVRDALLFLKNEAIIEMNPDGSISLK